MHKTITMKHWSHHLHDSIEEHLHSRHFWAGVAMTLLILAFVTVLFILAMNAPIIYPHELPYVPYM